MKATQLALLLFPFAFLQLHAGAQVVKEPYSGLRVALFDFDVLQIRGKSVMLKCRFANTGRQEAGQKKNAAQTVVELDTANLPAILWGHEKEVAEEAIVQMPRLKPGELSSAVWLNITVKNPLETSSLPPGACPDLIVDTAYIFRFSDDDILLRFEVKNIGNAPVEVDGKAAHLGINVYFVAGTKLTRGAIPAGSTTIESGRETLTGWLKPGQKLRGEINLDLKNRTKFAPNILFELAPPASIPECDRTNNTRSIEVNY